MSDALEPRHQPDSPAAHADVLVGVARDLNDAMAVVVGRLALLEEKLARTRHAEALTKLRGAVNRCSCVAEAIVHLAHTHASAATSQAMRP